MIPSQSPAPCADCHFYGACPYDDWETCEFAPTSDDDYIEVQRRIFREEFHEYVDAFEND